MDDGPYRMVEGGADVPRRVLADEDIDAVIAAEIDERWRAIDEYARREQPTEALRLQLETLRRSGSVSSSSGDVHVAGRAQIRLLG